eukprot:158962_1
MKQYNMKSKFTRTVRRIVVDNINHNIANTHKTMSVNIKKKPFIKPKVISSVYCWQWKDDNGYKNYSHDVSNEIENVYSNSDHDHGKIITKKFGTQTYEIKPFQMTQVNKATQFARIIRRINVNEKNENDTSNKMKWQWCDNGTKWTDYDKVTSIAIEKSYANAKNVHQINVKSKTYEIRFNTLKQCNLSTNFERDIRRVVLNENSAVNINVRNRGSDDDYKSSESWTGPKRKTFGKQILTLYHVTDKKAADAISKSGRMIRGSNGMFGGGIYFAESINSAKYKSEHKGGWVIEARVLVGKTFIAKDASVGKFDFNKLQSKQCDSVHAPNGSGKGASERVVYNWDQVCIVSVKKIN